MACCDIFLKEQGCGDFVTIKCSSEAGYGLAVAGAEHGRLLLAFLSAAAASITL